METSPVVQLDEGLTHLVIVFVLATIFLLTVHYYSIPREFEFPPINQQTVTEKQSPAAFPDRRSQEAFEGGADA